MHFLLIPTSERSLSSVREIPSRHPSSLFRATLLFLCALAWTGVGRAQAQSPAVTKAQDWEIHLELIAVILPESFALPLLDELEDRATAPAAFEKIQAEIAGGRAIRAGIQRTKSEHRMLGVSEATEEVRYPIEYETLTFPNLDDKKSVNAIPKDAGAVSMPATTFETRNTGLRLETITQVSGDGQTLRIEGKLDHTRLIKWDEYASGITPAGTKVVASQPRFFHANSTGVFFLRSSERLLAGIHKLPDQKETLELFFLRGWTQPKPRKTPAAK